MGTPNVRVGKNSMGGLKVKLRILKGTLGGKKQSILTKATRRKTVDHNKLISCPAASQRFASPMDLGPQTPVQNMEVTSLQLRNDQTSSHTQAARFRRHLGDRKRTVAGSEGSNFWHGILLFPNHPKLNPENFSRLMDGRQTVNPTQQQRTSRN